MVIITRTLLAALAFIPNLYPKPRPFFIDFAEMYYYNISRDDCQVF